MIVTGALLAESASAVDNKLHVEGGVIDKFKVGSGRVVAVTLVVLIQPQPFDKSPALNLTVRTPTGDSRRTALDVPESSLGGGVGFICAPLRISVPVDGSYVLSVDTESGSIALPLTVAA